MSRQKKKHKPKRIQQRQELPAIVEEVLTRAAEDYGDLKSFRSVVKKADLLATAKNIGMKPTGRSIRDLSRTKVSQKDTERIWRKVREKPQGSHWADNLTVPKLTGTADVSGQTTFQASFSPDALTAAVNDGLCDNDHELAESSAMLAGADPAKVRSSSAAIINGGPSATVYKFDLDADGNKKSFILLACNHPQDTPFEAMLRNQYRGLLFYKFGSNRIIGPKDKVTHSDRMGSTPRPHCPPELVTPYLEGFGVTKDADIYMFTCETAFGDRSMGGVELNQFGKGDRFTQNLPNQPKFSSDQSLKLSKEIIRVYTQLFACTLDSATGIGAVPSKLSLNNGDVIVDPKSLKIRVGSVSDIFRPQTNEDPALCKSALVDLFTSPRNFLQRTGEPQGWILDPSLENLPLLHEGMAQGFNAVFHGRGNDMATDCLREYAKRQDGLFDGIISDFHRLSRSSDRSIRAGRGLLESSQRIMRSHLVLAVNPPIMKCFSADLQLNVADSKGWELTPSYVDFVNDRYRDMVAPKELIGAIKTL